MSPKPKRQNIFLAGMMGVGKSSVGELVAARLDYRFLDTDAIIETVEGRTIVEIFAEDGEAYFRRLEADVLQQICESEMQVVATGGGMLIEARNLSLAESSGLVVLLTAAMPQLVNRLKGNDQRPLLTGGALEEQLVRLQRLREGAMGEILHRVDTTDLTTSEVAETVARMYEEWLLETAL